MSQFRRRLDKINIIVGGLISSLAIILVLNIFISVVQRYILNSNYMWQSELSLAISAVIFLLCSGYTYYFNSHVRVDIAYEKFSSKHRAIVNIIGILLLLFPMCFAIIYFSYEFIVSSWKILESSAEYSGIKGVFLLKSLLWGFPLLLIISGVSQLISFSKVLNRESDGK
jgi:TRAP-type mannitol/chloroaromatic compound transport system permease small subunit